MVNKILLYCILLFSCLEGQAQQIELMPKGIRSTETNKDYVLLTFDNMSNKELYDNTLIYLNQRFTNPKKVIKFSVENKLITFKEVEHMKKITTNDRLRDSFSKSVSVDITISFKDNVVKYEVGNFSFGALVLLPKNIFKVSIWDKDGVELYLPEEKKNIEVFLNELLDDYKSFMLKSNDEW
ncbi:MAG: hypothetical protein LBI72_07975 [Flavobacteriaceae bacterium]|jgi:hypothetical protein|nr:hypothetical protein [Flavobacteriaceae bacterium]